MSKKTEAKITTKKETSSAAQIDKKYVAFLRGINVGGNVLIKMAELQKTFESAGFRNVKTLIASGNVIFETTKKEPDTKLTQNIQAALKKRFNRDIGVMVRSIQEIQKIAETNPFKGIKIAPGIKLYVTFRGESKKSNLKIPYEFPDKTTRIIKVSDGEVFSVLQVTGKSTDFMKIMEKEFGKKITTRNWNTIEKILKM